MKLPQLFVTAQKTFSSAFSPQTARAVRRVAQKSVLAIGKAAAVAAPALLLGGQAMAQTAGHTAPAAEPVVSWWQAIVLGLVQGLTEFIPVSSSGHLNIVHQLMGHGRELTYDVFLHIGTTAALIYYFRNDWRELLTVKSQAKLRNLVFLGCIPAAVIGYKLRHLEDQPLFQAAHMNAIMLIVAGSILWISDKVGRKARELETLTVKDSLIIGTSQALALIPGVSRSGSTLTAGLFLGLKRSEAARFSFLMSLPITLGAIGFEFLNYLKEGHDAMTTGAGPVVLGIIISAASGFWAISFLLNYLKTKDVTLFFVWRVVVGLAVLALFFLHKIT
jgi:undecaprenyl-diphosphatase